MYRYPVIYSKQKRLLLQALPFFDLASSICYNLDMAKMLIVVDYQNDFIDGSLGFLGASDLYPNILSKIKEYDSRGDEVIFTKDTHGEDYLKTEEGKNLPIPHCIKGSQGHHLFGDLEDVASSHKVIEKATFPSLELGNYLKDKDVDEVELVGLDLSICVISNAVMAKAALPNARISVDLSCSSSGDKQAIETTIKQMERLQIFVKK